MPAASGRPLRRGSPGPNWRACTSRDTSSRGKDHISVVTGPVSMPFIPVGRLWAYLIHSAVMAADGSVAIDHRRLHAARAVALHPAEAGEDVTVSCSAKYSTMSLRSASPCTSTIQPQLFLDLHRMADLAVHRLDVLGLAQLALLERLAGQADRLVCGKEPMVVIRNAGRSSPARCLAMRSANGERRWTSLALIASQARLHGRLWIRGEEARLAWTARLYSTAASTSAASGSVAAQASTATRGTSARQRPASSSARRPAVFASGPPGCAAANRTARPDRSPGAPGHGAPPQGFLQVATRRCAVDQASGRPWPGRQAVEDARITVPRSPRTMCKPSTGGWRQAQVDLPGRRSEWRPASSAARLRRL